MTTAPSDQRRYGILLLGVAAVFVTIAIVAGAFVTPWMYLVGLTAIPNVITGVKALRRPKPSDP